MEGKGGDKDGKEGKHPNFPYCLGRAIATPPGLPTWFSLLAHRSHEDVQWERYYWDPAKPTRCAQPGTKVELYVVLAGADANALRSGPEQVH
jgi:hypothetical protein